MTLVQDSMQPHVTVVYPGTPLSAVMRFLTSRGVRHLPVVESGAVVGIISDRDVKGALLSAATAFEGRELGKQVEELRAGQITEGMSQPGRSAPEFEPPVSLLSSTVDLEPRGALAFDEADDGCASRWRSSPRHETDGEAPQMP